MTDWTEKQREVIETRGSDLLCAAAAGSGKTAVLVEKIKKLIIDERKDIDRFLVVTFTRAAASEMKEKIADALIKQAGEDPGSAAYMQRQLEKLSEAWICTFDSFIIDIVRQYFYIIDIEPDLRICSPEDSSIISIQSMDEMFQRLYEEGRDDIVCFLDAYSSPKSDSMLKEKLMHLYESFRAMPGGLDWLEDQISQLEMDEETFRNSKLMQQLIRTVRSEAEKAAKLLSEAYDLLVSCGVIKLAAKVLDELEQAQKCAQCSEDDAYELFSSLKFAQMRLTKDEKPAYIQIEEEFRSKRDSAKELLKACRDKYFSMPLSEAVSEMNATSSYVKTLLYMLRIYEQINSEKKQAEGQMDFADANHFALEILKNEDVAAQIRDRFDYIFIDEYQDSNYIQEEIVTAIKKDDNLFMVGDIKQSIYGFRMAEPDIFRNRYRKYARAEDFSGQKIDLNTNFRSKQSVIDTVNDIFKDLMDDYDEDAMLYRGDAYDGPVSHQSELHIIDKDTFKNSFVNEEDEADKQRNNDKAESDDQASRTELSTLKNIEIEAFLAAHLIKENLGKEIFDSKLGEIRTIEKKDIVILMRNARNRAEKIYDILMQEGIEAIVDDNSGYFESVEIETLTDMLRVIDNRHQDIPLLSVLRSGIFDFTIDELIRIRLSADEGDYYETLYDFAEGADNIDETGKPNRQEDTALRKKAAYAVEKINDWAERSMYLSCEELTSDIISSSGYYAYAGALPGGKQRQANIRQLLEKAAEFDRKGNGTIFGFLKYIEVIRQNTDSSQAQISDDAEDAVRIMTVHKSKGLEFPVVIVLGLGEAFKGTKIEATGIWHKDLGFAMRYTDLEKRCWHNTMLAHMISDRKSQDSLEEEIRILYVACTRAKEKLMLVGCRGGVKDPEGSYLNLIESVIDRGITSVKEYGYGCIADIIDDASNVRAVAGSDDLGMVFCDDEGRGSHYQEKRNELPADSVRNTVSRMLSFKYPHEDDLTIKSKYSVSELNAGDEPHIEIKRPHYRAEDKHISGAAFGTLMHLVMERLDFDSVFKAFYSERSSSEETDHGNADRHQRATDCVEECIRMLVQEKAITEEEAAAVRTDKIIRFFESDLGQRISRADAVYKEKQFNILHEKDGHEIIVQGIIDCYFIENGHIVLLDYKTNYNTEGIEDIYREQLALYKEALEKSTGLEVTESYLYLFKEDRAVSIEL